MTKILVTKLEKRLNLIKKIKEYQLELANTYENNKLKFEGNVNKKIGLNKLNIVTFDEH